MADQTEAPYLDALVAYVARNPGRFHIPGHKGTGADPGLIDALGEAAILHDVPPSIEGIDVGPEPTPFQRAQRLAADAWGAQRSWFLVNGASGGNHAICMALAHASGQARHRATPPRAASWSSATSTPRSSTAWCSRAYGRRSSRRRSIRSSASPTASRPRPSTRRSIAEPDAVAAMLVSPTYFGAVAGSRSSPRSPMPATSRWSSTRPGAPTSTSTRPCRPGALRCGADLVLSSTHKIVGSLTQSAILHLGDGRADRRGPDRPLRDPGRVDEPQRIADRLPRCRAALRRHPRARSCSTGTLASLARTRERDPRDPRP